MAPDTPSALHRVALDTAARGWPVFPLRPGAKRPALHGEDRCPRTGPCESGHLVWEQRATTEPKRIERAWSHRAYNVGLATGPAGLVVVDLDTPKNGDDVPPPEWARRGVADGLDVFAVLCEEHGQPLPTQTFTVRTGRGGRHLYFEAPAGKRLRSSGGLLGWKVDTRACGGYVVAAGSRVGGQSYDVLVDQPPAPLPAWLHQLLTPPPAPVPPKATPRTRTAVKVPDAYAASALLGELEKVGSARQGGRNRAVYFAAYALARFIGAGTLPEHVVTDELTAAATGIGLPPTEAAAAIRSGLARGAQRGMVSAA